MNANTYYNNYGAVQNQDWQQAHMGSDDMEMGVSKLDTNLSIRLGFIKKVYGIVSAQLLLTVFFCLISMNSPSFAKFQLEHKEVFGICLIGSIVLMIVLTCCSQFARQYPTNYILLTGFTICEAYLISYICSLVNAKIVLMAASLTCAVVIGLTIYACTTKTDFTVCNSMLFIASLVLLLMGIMMIFVKSPILHLIYSGLGTFLFALYLVYDTQLIIGNKENQLDIDDYVYGALMLYVDIIQLFLHILRILVISNKN